MKKVFKKLTLAMLSVATIVGATTFISQKAYANTNEIKVMVDGEYVSFDVAPINQNGSVFVPMRAIFESLGYDVKWIAEFEAVESYKVEDNYLIGMALYKGNQMNLSYKEYITDYTPSSSHISYRRPEEMSTNFTQVTTFSPSYQNVNGRVLVPVRAISEGTGADVKWDGANQTVIIDSSNPIITNIETGVSYDVNGAKTRVDSYFASGDNNSANNNSNNNNSNTNDNQNTTTETTEMTREEKELEIVRLVNEERVKAGLNELEIRDDLMYVARWHAEEQAELNYFSHTSPTYNLAHTELARALGANYTVAGENSHKGSTSTSSAMDSWLNSAGHKRHILDPEHKYIGVGFSGVETRYWSLFMGY